MSSRTDPAWDEYLSTGEDPTGGELDERPRFKPQQPSNGTGCGVIFFIATAIFLGIVSLTQKSNEEKETQRQREIEVQNTLIRQKELEQRRMQESISYRRQAVSDSVERAIAAETAARRKADADAFRQQMIRKARASTYDDGYRDGYECGYDDGDCNEGYGYSWISADMEQFYSSAYKEGFRIGYREGFSAGMEDYQYSNGI